MPQYLVAVYHPDDYDPSVETEATIEEIHALNRELKCCRRQEVRLRPFPGRQRKIAAVAARRKSARHRRAVHRDQGAHRRFLDTRGR